MPNYIYQCDNCGTTIEEYRPIKDGPDKGKHCPECSEIMSIPVQGCGILFKGDNGMDKDYALSEMAEKSEKFLDETDEKKKEAAEVLGHRRKGHRHFNEWKKHNRPKVDRYWKNKTEGFKGRQNAGVQVRKV